MSEIRSVGKGIKKITLNFLMSWNLKVQNEYKKDIPITLRYVETYCKQAQ